MLTNPKILFKYASRSRPDNFFRGLDNIKSMIQTDNYQILCTLDVDDRTMANNKIKDRIHEYENVQVYYGFSKSKVEAINRDMCFADPFDILINMSDDIVFTQPCFDEFIKEDMNRYFPDGDCFLHYVSDNLGDRVPIVSIMDKIYYHRFKNIYNPDYTDFFADNEAMEVAKRLGRYKKIKREIFYHLHPEYGLADWDEMYLNSKKNYQKDYNTFVSRHEKNFDL